MGNIRDLVTAHSQGFQRCSDQLLCSSGSKTNAAPVFRSGITPPPRSWTLPAQRPRVGPHWGKAALSPASDPGVLQSAIQELKAQMFHHPEAPEEIIGLCTEAQMDTG